MSELRKDHVTGRWVIIPTERRKRPTDFRLESVSITPDDGCPFCEGHEHMTPRELLAHRRNGSGPNSPGWDLRVVPNQFPVLRVEGSLDRQAEERRVGKESRSGCGTASDHKEASISSVK